MEEPRKFAGYFFFLEDDFSVVDFDSLELLSLLFSPDLAPPSLELSFDADDVPFPP